MVVLNLDVTSTSIPSLPISALLVRCKHSIDSTLISAVIKVVQRLENSILALQDPVVEPPWESFGELVAHVRASWDSEDVVELFESALLRLRDPEEDHDQRDDVGSGIEAEYTCGAHGIEHERQEHRQDTGPEEASSDSPAHSNLTVGKGEDFSGVCEWDWTLAGRIEHSEDVDEHRYERQVSCLCFIYESAETCCKE
jgi:hypothetical protein